MYCSTIEDGVEMCVSGVAKIEASQRYNHVHVHIHVHVDE
jgi:hypothetical protein